MKTIRSSGPKKNRGAPLAAAIFSNVREADTCRILKVRTGVMIYKISAPLCFIAITERNRDLEAAIFRTYFVSNLMWKGENEIRRGI